MLDRAFCFACRNFNSGRTYVISIIGFSHWKHALEKEKGLTKHDSSVDHMIAMARWDEYRRIKSNTSMSIENILDPKGSSIIKDNREYLKMLLEFHRYFCLQELPYRGHHETQESLNPGNWKEFIKIPLSTNSIFATLSKKLKTQYSLYDYTSKSICMEFIKALADETECIVKEKLELAGTYSLLIDECKDNAGHEELALCFLYVNQDCCIEERFYEIVRLKDTDAESIFQIGVLNTLQNIGLTGNLIALGADGASVMSGCNEGVCSKLKRRYKWVHSLRCAPPKFNCCYLPEIYQCGKRIV